MISLGNRRLFWIDILRGSAIFLVLFPHVESVPGFVLHERTLTYAFNQAGWMGVDLFFVISGYLIGTIVFREIDRSGDIRLRRFFLRRAFRIFPVYYFLYFLVMIAPESIGVPDRDFLPGLFYLQNYGGMLTHFNFTHSWSLCVEEHFYLSFPLLCFLLFRSGRLHWFPGFVGVVFFVSLFFRVYHSLADTKIDFLFYSHTRAEGIALGCLIAYTFVFRPELVEKIRARKVAIGIGSFLLLIPAWSVSLFESFWIQTLGISCVALAFFGLVFLGAAAREPRTGWKTAFWPVTQLGIYSYTLYLIHPMLLQLSIIKWIAWPLHLQVVAGFSTFVDPNTAMLISYIVLSLVFAVALSFLIEKPFLFVRNKWVR